MTISAILVTPCSLSSTWNHANPITPTGLQLAASLTRMWQRAFGRRGSYSSLTTPPWRRQTRLPCRCAFALLGVSFNELFGILILCFDLVTLVMLISTRPSIILVRSPPREQRDREVRDSASRWWAQLRLLQRTLRYCWMFWIINSLKSFLERCS